MTQKKEKTLKYPVWSNAMLTELSENLFCDHNLTEWEQKLFNHWFIALTTSKCQRYLTKIAEKQCRKPAVLQAPVHLGQVGCCLHGVLVFDAVQQGIQLFLLILHGKVYPGRLSALATCVPACSASILRVAVSFWMSCISKYNNKIIKNTKIQFQGEQWSKVKCCILLHFSFTLTN